MWDLFAPARRPDKEFYELAREIILNKPAPYMFRTSTIKKSLVNPDVADDTCIIKNMENGHKFIFKLPGLTASDVDLTKEDTINGFKLCLKAKKEDEDWGVTEYNYERQINYQAKDIKTKMENGILIVEIIGKDSSQKAITSQKIAIE